MMPPIRDWVLRFLNDHQLRFRPTDFPATGTIENREFVRLWMTAFADESVSEREAQAASAKLGTNPPRFRNDHLPAVIAIVRQARKTAPSRTLDARQEAETASRSCLRCGPGIDNPWAKAMGRVHVFHRRYRGQPVLMMANQWGATREVAVQTMAYCICPYGRWLKDHAGPDDPTPDLQDVIDGRLNGWLDREPVLASDVSLPARDKPAAGPDTTLPRSRPGALVQ